MKVAIQNCPVCGGTPKLNQTVGWNNEDIWFVECPLCRLAGPKAIDVPKIECVKDWNRLRYVSAKAAAEGQKNG